MPYIKQEQRIPLEEPIKQLTAEIVKLSLKGDLTGMSGLLNYSFSRILMGVIRGTGGIRYHKIASVSGMLKNVSDEFYRRVVVPYEDRQIKANGDIPEYESNDELNRV